ncbi:MAG TPA: FAD binding domain-containing protein [candidate division Zixibacteria bacterium]|nr:FAD binding domain-containing protein [candidate division Zixibacteria bacterium]
MLRLPDFEYIRPASLKEAARVLSDLGPEAMAVAGGTDVYPKMKRGQFTPRHLVSLRTLGEIRGIRADGREGLWIGAGETLANVAESRTIAELFPALSCAAGSVSTPPLRNTGTIGGNVFVDTRCNYYDQTFFWRQAAGFCMKKDGSACLVAPRSPLCLAVFSSDTAPVLCSLGAEAVLTSPRGTRCVPLSRLYRNDGMRFLTKGPDELLEAIVIPRAAFGLKNVYLKLRRRGSFDFPILGVAAALDLDRQSVCRSASVVLTGVASAPQAVEAAPRLLVGRKLEREAIDAVAEEAAKVSHPVDNADLDYWYRKRMTKVFVRRALARLGGTEANA